MLTPSVYPRDEFVKATKLQTILNKLMHHIAFDYEFLKETLASTIKVDTFTNELFKIYETVRAENSGQVSDDLKTIMLQQCNMIYRFNYGDKKLRSI